MRIERPVKTSCPDCGSRTLYWWYSKSNIHSTSSEYGIYCSTCKKNFPDREEQKSREFVSRKTYAPQPVMTSERVGEISFSLMMLTLRQKDVTKLDPEQIAEMVGISFEEFSEYMKILSHSAARNR